MNQRLPSFDALLVPHCNHCFMAETRHIAGKCLYGPLYFDPICCPLCNEPLTFANDDTEVERDWLTFPRRAVLCSECGC
jgi:hypothetical protein